jgi:hypothetical protein
VSRPLLSLCSCCVVYSAVRQQGICRQLFFLCVDACGEPSCLQPRKPDVCLASGAFAWLLATLMPHCPNRRQVCWREGRSALLLQQFLHSRPPCTSAHTLPTCAWKVKSAENRPCIAAA